MTERFKQYLEAAFRKIKPTKAAMEYRKKRWSSWKNSRRISV